MKKGFLLLVIALFISQFGFSQDKKMSIGLGFGGASAKAKGESETDSGFGFTFYGNAMYNINERISAGLEYNSNLAVIGSADNASIEATGITGILAKGKYRFGTGRTNFYGGLNAGLYMIRPGKISMDTNDGSYDITLDKKSVLGVAPEIGVHLGSFQIATSYHILGKYKYEDLEDADINYGLWQFTIGWNIGLIAN